MLEVPECSDLLMHLNIQDTQINPFLLMPLVIDFLRKVALHKGRVIFIEDNKEASTKHTIK